MSVTCAQPEKQNCSNAETEAQVALLTAAGTSHFQGFLFAHPLRSEDARSLAENGLVAEQQECDPVAIAPMILV